MWKYHQFVFCLLCLWDAASSSFRNPFTDFYLESVTVLYVNPELTFAYTNASLKRKEHDHPTISVEVDLRDAIRNYDGDAKIYYSPLGNQRFILLPFKFDRQPICEYMEYKVILDAIRGSQNYSNFPAPLPGNKSVQFCELFTMGHYYLRNFKIDKSAFLPYTPTGRYRWVGFAYHRALKKVVQGIDLVATFV